LAALHPLSLRSRGESLTPIYTDATDWFRGLSTGIWICFCLAVTVLHSFFVVYETRLPVPWEHFDSGNRQGRICFIPSHATDAQLTKAQIGVPRCKSVLRLPSTIPKSAATTPFIFNFLQKSPPPKTQQIYPVKPKSRLSPSIQGTSTLDNISIHPAIL
jgi:hypothetical protein